MSATKILWHQVILVCLVVLAFLWAATEWTAWRLGFQPQRPRVRKAAGEPDELRRMLRYASM